MIQMRLLNKEVVFNDSLSKQEMVITIALPIDVIDSDSTSIGQQLKRFVTDRFKNRKIAALLS